MAITSQTVPQPHERRFPPLRLIGAGAILIDVRTAEERKYEGFVPGSVHVAWQTGHPRKGRAPFRHSKGYDAKVIPTSVPTKTSRLAANSNEGP